jgi:hypothetical protein
MAPFRTGMYQLIPTKLFLECGHSLRFGPGRFDVQRRLLVCARSRRDDITLR